MAFEPRPPSLTPLLGKKKLRPLLPTDGPIYLSRPRSIYLSAIDILAIDNVFHALLGVGGLAAGFSDRRFGNLKRVS